MVSASICSLVLLALYLGKRWMQAAADNQALRTQVASLKRRLAQREGR